MVLQEKTATFIDRLGHTASQEILPDPGFDHLEGSVIETEPVIRPRDIVIVQAHFLAQSFQPLFDEVGAERTTQLMEYAMGKAMEATGNDEKQKVFERKQKDGYGSYSNVFTVYSEPAMNGISIVFQDFEIEEELLIGLNKDTAIVAKRDLAVDEEDRVFYTSDYENVDPLTLEQQFGDLQLAPTQEEIAALLPRARELDQKLFGNMIRTMPAREVSN